MMSSSWAAGRSVPPAPGSSPGRAGACWCSIPAGRWGRAGGRRPECWRPRSRPTTTTRSSSWASPAGSTTAPLAATLRETTGIDIGLWQEGIAAVAAGRGRGGGAALRVAWQRQQGTSPTGSTRRRCGRAGPGSGPPGRALGRRTKARSSRRSWCEALLAERRAARRRHRRGTRRDSASSSAGDRVVGRDRGERRYAGRRGRASRRARGPALVRGLAAAARGRAGARADGRAALARGCPRAIVYGHDCYLVARGDEAIVGSTMEYVGFRAEVTRPGSARIFRRRHRALPALDRAHGGAPGPDSGPSPRRLADHRRRAATATASGTPPVTGGTAFCSPDSPACIMRNS